ncbi:MAG: RHS repeat-associated core domain-containing protein [Anaeromyxobacteraceae bacterium]
MGVLAESSWGRSGFESNWPTLPVAGSPGPSAGTTRYLLDGLSVVAQYDTAGTRQAWYTQSLARIDEVLNVVNASGKFWYEADALGSVYALTTQAGEVRARGGYDVFGESVALGGTAVGQPFGFTGREHEADSGLTYYRDRYMQAAFGRWSQVDRLGDVDGPGLYGYVTGRPTLLSDPTGRYSVYAIALGRAVTCLAGISFMTVGIRYLAVSSTFDSGIDEDFAELGIAYLFGGIEMVLMCARCGEWMGKPQEHHLLPREFRRDFQRLGIDIEKYKIRLPTSLHNKKGVGIHNGPDSWNVVWREFFRARPNATRVEVLVQLTKMMREFGLELWKALDVVTLR